jgi:parallel beta-helix repeat protein
MNRTTLAVFLFTLIIVTFLASQLSKSGHRADAQSAPASAQPRLPGARPAIDASQFPTLQAAIDAIPEAGGVLQLPAGTFEIKEPLVLARSDVQIVGAGTATHIKNVNAEGKPALLIQHPKGRGVPQKDRLWRIMLSNLRITGNEKSGHGINAVQVNEIFIQGVTVSYHGGHGIFLDQCYEDPRINDCLITYNKFTGLELHGCHDIVVSGNHFEENMDALHCFDSFNLCMTGNNLDDHLGHGVVIENTYGSVVSGNMIEECNGVGVVLDRNCYGITVSANVIAHNNGGADLRDAHGCAISANTFTINQSNALRIGPDSGRITVSANNFSNSYQGAGAYARGTTTKPATQLGRLPEVQVYGGVLLDGTSDIAITGNNFAGLKPKAIIAGEQPSKRITFVGNVLTDGPSDHEKFVDSVVNGNVVDR